MHLPNLAISSTSHPLATEALRDKPLSNWHLSSASLSPRQPHHQLRLLACNHGDCIHRSVANCFAFFSGVLKATQLEWHPLTLDINNTINYHLHLLDKHKSVRELQQVVNFYVTSYHNISRNKPRNWPTLAISSKVIRAIKL